MIYSFRSRKNTEDWSFEKAWQKYGCDVYVFENSGYGAAKTLGPKIKVFPYGITAMQRNGALSSNSESQKSNLTLASLYQKMIPIHGTKIIDYLKIDTEFDGFELIAQIRSSGMLHSIRQMGIQIRYNSLDTIEQHRLNTKIIKSLEDLGMIRFSSKRSPTTLSYFEAMDITAYTTYEMAWYNIHRTWGFQTINVKNN